VFPLPLKQAEGNVVSPSSPVVRGAARSCVAVKSVATARKAARTNTPVNRTGRPSRVVVHDATRRQNDDDVPSTDQHIRLPSPTDSRPAMSLHRRCRRNIVLVRVVRRRARRVLRVWCRKFLSRQNIRSPVARYANIAGHHGRQAA